VGLEGAFPGRFEVSFDDLRSHTRLHRKSGKHDFIPSDPSLDRHRGEESRGRKSKREERTPSKGSTDTFSNYSSHAYMRSRFRKRHLSSGLGKNPAGDLGANYLFYLCKRETDRMKEVNEKEKEGREGEREGRKGRGRRRRRRQ
jgi:hypothetical protein